MTTTTKRSFLLEKVPSLLNTLHVDTKPTFGLMTPQHMVEHLTWIIKSSVKNFGEPPAEPTKGQLGFKRFIEKGAVFQHRPSDKTVDDLPPLKYASLEEALAQIPIAVARFYNFFDGHPEKKLFNPMMGQLGFEEIELFHFQHCRYHLWQFGLLGQYP